MAPCIWIFLAVALQAPLETPPEPGTHGHFLVLTGKTRTPPPFAVVDMVYGPREDVEGATWFWWELSVKTENRQNGAPLFRLRGLTSRDPLGPTETPLLFRRYLLQVEGAQEALEYRNAASGGALLPPWRDFKRLFIPRRAKGCGKQRSVAETAEYLGHVLTLQYAGYGVAWKDWGPIKCLTLDPELLVGTSRNFRDSEGRRLPQKPERRNYNYVPFVESEYPVMAEAGINSYIVDEAQFLWVRGEPVFHIRRGGKNIVYPADLYRSNYLGSVMFLDEPGIIMVGDKNIHNTLRHFSDATAVLQKRIHESVRSSGSYSAFRLEESLRKAGVNFGDMRLEQHDYPAWETLFEMAYYQLEAGLRGVVHEGRYQLETFDKAVARWTDTPRKHTTREMLRYHYAILRGAARAFGGYWGTSIYGQCDPEVSPEAMTLAYDMGARYIWFWTLDHDHHMPWPEQLRLARHLKAHAAKRPRPSLHSSQPVLDKVIVIPYGYFVSLENLWWVRVLDREGKNEASQKYRRLMHRVISEVYRAFENGEDFDITIDGGSPPKRYRKVVYVTDAE